VTEKANEVGTIVAAAAGATVIPNTKVVPTSRAIARFIQCLRVRLEPGEEHG
jgi:hypothetical protein